MRLHPKPKMYQALLPRFPRTAHRSAARAHCLRYANTSPLSDTFGFVFVHDAIS